MFTNFLTYCDSVGFGWSTAKLWRNRLHACVRAEGVTFNVTYAVLNIFSVNILNK